MAMRRPVSATMTSLCGLALLLEAPGGGLQGRAATWGRERRPERHVPRAASRPAAILRRTRIAPLSRGTGARPPRPPSPGRVPASRQASHRRGNGPRPCGNSLCAMLPASNRRRAWRIASRAPGRARPHPPERLDDWIDEGRLIRVLDLFVAELGRHPADEGPIIGWGHVLDFLQSTMTALSREARATNPSAIAGSRQEGTGDPRAGTGVVPPGGCGQVVPSRNLDPPAPESPAVGRSGKLSRAMLAWQPAIRHRLRHWSDFAASSQPGSDLPAAAAGPGDQRQGGPKNRKRPFTPANSPQRR